MELTNKERQTSLTFASPEGEHEVTASATLTRDDGYLAFNRISVLTTAGEGVGLMRLADDTVHFRVPISERQPQTHQTWGTGSFTSVGSSKYAPGISDETVYPTAHLEIYSYVDVHKVWKGEPSELLTHLTIWPQPSGWWVNPSLFTRWDGTITKVGRTRSVWHRAAQRKIDYRFSQRYLHIPRDSDRLGDERMWMPVIDIRPQHGAIDPASYREAVGGLWLLLKSILSFYYGQTFSLIERTESDGKTITTTSWPHKLSAQRSRRRDRGIGIGVDSFCADAAKVADARGIDPRELHGAVHLFNQGTSTDLSWEQQATSLVEGVECLLVIFETTKKLSREALSRWEARELKAKVSLATSDISFTQGRGRQALEKRAIVSRHVAMRPLLTLEERVQRMLRMLARRADPLDEVLIAHLKECIEVRNDIVHGRRTTDVVSIVSARRTATVLFERLFCLLLGERRIVSSDFEVEGLMHKVRPRVTSHNTY
jgi:hypothetical protein